MNHIIVLDIGKTNKKCFVFDEDYQIVHESSAVLPEKTDEDGFPCEDLNNLTRWVQSCIREVFFKNKFNLRAINVSAYGASLVHLNAAGNPVAPLYNYLKPFPDDLLRQFLEAYGPADKIALETTSPLLGNLNSGLQLYAIKHCKPEIFRQIKWSVHLPQYIAYNIAVSLGWPPEKHLHSEMTGIGCHTMLWDMSGQEYHHWVKTETLDVKLPPIVPTDTSIHIIPSTKSKGIKVGVGVHDSSAALIPYLLGVKNPFVLLSTGTWCITLNPFNQTPLSAKELKQDSLCYLSWRGQPVRASRFFGGKMHDNMVQKIASNYGVATDFYLTDPDPGNGYMDHQNALSDYQKSLKTLVEKLSASIKLVFHPAQPVEQLFVDGGFAQNPIFMRCLAEAFPDMQVLAADVPQATALGAALAIHEAWNTKPLPDNFQQHHVV